MLSGLVLRGASRAVDRVERARKTWVREEGLGPVLGKLLATCGLPLALSGTASATHLVAEPTLWAACAALTSPA